MMFIKFTASPSIPREVEAKIQFASLKDLCSCFAKLQDWAGAVERMEAALARIDRLLKMLYLLPAIAWAFGIMGES